MVINKTVDGTTLQVSIEGRLDTNSAPEFEAELGSLEGVEKLALDFGKLEYVSSAGLRIILTLQKKMAKQGEMTISNVLPQVKEVLDITGFSDILTII